MISDPARLESLLSKQKTAGAADKMRNQHKLMADTFKLLATAEAAGGR